MATYLLSVNPAAEARLMAEIDSLGDLTELNADSLDKVRTACLFTSHHACCSCLASH